MRSTATGVAMVALLGLAGAGCAAGSKPPGPPVGPAAAFVPIIEPFDPGHPALARTGGGTCSDAQTTVAMENCYEANAENADAAIDSLRRSQFAVATAAGKAAINADDERWIKGRPQICAAAYQSGGSIDEVDIASCLADVSVARLDGLRGVAPEGHLQGTDNTDVSQLAYFTAADGTRVGLIHTHGDQTGGAVVAWVIIGGYRGYRVEPAQFRYVDGSFTDLGILQDGSAAGHQVGVGRMYQFSVDYSRLASDPGAANATGGFDVGAGGVTEAVFR
ncbi:MAG: lysozyme inhibitor LprI family protein [Acidimicrobiales bacterium]